MAADRSLLLRRPQLLLLPGLQQGPYGCQQGWLLVCCQELPHVRMLLLLLLLLLFMLLVCCC
jgi:hypothetical protein